MKSKALTDLKAVPTLSPDDVMELERHEQAMLDIQSSLNPDMWMDSAGACPYFLLSFFSCFDVCRPVERNGFIFVPYFILLFTVYTLMSKECFVCIHSLYSCGPRVFCL